MKRIMLTLTAMASSIIATAATAVFAPGAGETLDVPQTIGGTDGVQVNTGSSGGGIVRLQSSWNTYAGDTVIKCGTLQAADMGATGLPSSLGLGGSVLLGNGTFRYNGPAATNDQALVLDAAAATDAAVVDVGSALTLTGGFRTNGGCLIKRGEGTLTLRHASPGVYSFGSEQVKSGDFLDFSAANGDSPTTGYGNFTVAGGRLVLDMPDTVTNNFGAVCNDVDNNNTGYAYVGKNFARAGEASVASHLVVLGGYHNFGNYVHIGYRDGNTGNVGAAPASSIDVCGGTVASTYLCLGKTGEDGVACTSRPELNVHGGKVRVRYLLVAPEIGSHAKVTVDGGTLEVAGSLYAAYTAGGATWEDQGIPVAEVSIVSNGFASVSGLEPSRSGLADFTLSLADGGRMNLWGNIASSKGGKVVIVGQGGSLRANYNADVQYRDCEFKIGNRGFTLSSSRLVKITNPVANVSGETDGVFTFTGEGNETGTLEFLSAPTFTGPLVIVGRSSLNLSAALPASSLTMDSGSLNVTGNATLNGLKGTHGVVNVKVVKNGSAMPVLTVNAIDAGTTLNVTLEGATQGSTYELFRFAKSSGMTAGRIFTASAGSGLSCTYATAEEGGLIKVRATVVAKASDADYAWTNAAGGNWSTDANWAGKVAPAPTASANISFATASAADKTPVTLNAAANVKSLSFSARPGYQIGGSGSLRFANGSSASYIAQTTATNAITPPIAYEGSFDSAVAQGARIELDKLSGKGDVTHGSSEAGSLHGVTTRGGIVINDASGIQGAIYARNGLFEVGAFGAGLTGLTTGFGLFRYSGTEDYALNGSYTYDESNWSSSSFEVTDENATFTVAGTVSGKSGGFYKLGKGTLAFAGTGLNRLDQTTSFGGYAFNVKDMETGIGNAGSYWPVDGSQRIPLYAGLIVAGGKLVWGVPGQTVVATNHETWIGSTTTSMPGKEYDAELEINGGTTYLKKLVLSREHGNSKFGTAEKSELVSKLTLNDGYVSIAGEVHMPYNSWGRSCTHPQLTVNGGELVTGGRFYLGYYQKGGHATFDMNGGVVRIGGALTLCDQYSDGPVTTLNVNGGELIVSDIVRALKGTCVVNLNEGGVIEARALQADGPGYDNTIVWNGGAYRPACPWDVKVQGWKKICVGEKGAVIDMSQMPNYANRYCTFSNDVEKAAGVAVDGGIRLRGNDQLRSVRFQPGCSYSNLAGGIRVEKGGSAYAKGTTLAAVAVTVGNGGAFVSPWTSVAGNGVKVKSLTLGDAASGKPMLLYTYGSGYITPIEVSDALTVNREVEVAMSDNNQTSFSLGAFTDKPILIAPKGSIDATRFRMSDRYWQGTISFAVSSYSDTMDQLTITSTTTGSGRTLHTWTAGTSGAWTTDANWDHPLSDHALEMIQFPSSLAQDIVVSLGGARSFGILTQASAHSVTLNGGSLTIGNGGQVGTVSGGSITLPSFASSSAVTLNPSRGAGKVVLGESKGAQAVNSMSGTLEATPDNFGTGAVGVDNATLSVVGNGVVKAKVTGTNGMNLKVDDEAYFADDVVVSGPFVKTGKGTATLGGAGQVTIGTANRSNGDNLNTAKEIPANGDLPTDGLAVFAVAGGKLTVGAQNSQKVSVSGRIEIGQNIADYDENDQVLDAELEVVGGKLETTGDLHIGHTAGAYRQARDCGEKKRNLALTVRGGEVKFGGCYMAEDITGYYNGTASMNIYGGKVTSTGQYIRFGSSRTSQATTYGGSKSVVNVFGGVFTNTVTELKQPPGYSGDFDLNLHGGVFAWTAPFRCDGGNSSQKIRFNMCGGMFIAPYIHRTYNGADIAFYWNGGELMPTADQTLFSQTKNQYNVGYQWNGNVVSTNGAAFNIPGSNLYTLNQAFTHDPALGATADGGIVKRGTGTLLLSVANTFTGPCTVEDGEMKISTATAVVGGLVVNGTGLFNLNGCNLTVPFLEGNGGRVAGGVLTVTERLDSGATVTVEHLVLGPNVVLRYVEGALFNVTGSVSGRLGIDFGRTESTRLPRQFEAKIADLPAAGGAPHVYGLNTGWTENRRYIVGEVRTNGQGGRELWVKLVSAGMAVFIR